MMKKTMIITSIVLVVIISVSIAFILNNETPANPGNTNEVSWPNAINILNSGNVAHVSQAHSLEVTLIMKNGDRYVTTEPEIDVIWEEIRKCGEPCEDMVMSTE